MKALRSYTGRNFYGVDGPAGRRPHTRTTAKVVQSLPGWLPDIGRVRESGQG